VQIVIKNRVNKIKKSQSWSLDITIAVVVFMAAFLVVYGVLSANKSTKVSDLQDDASIVVKQVASGDSDIKVLSNNEINESKLGRLKNIDYDKLKSELRVQGEFCIYFEDDKGNLVLINNSYRGIGSSQILIGGTPCSQR